MKPLKFTAKYQGKRCNFEISAVSGSGGLWHLYIDGYYYGAFVHYLGRWALKPQHDHYFTPEQVAILEDQLERHCPEP